MQRTSTAAAAIASVFLFAACGPDKNYDEPLGESANEAANDTLAGISELALAHDNGDDEALGTAVTGTLFGGASQLIGAKYAAGNQQFGLRSADGVIGDTVSENLRSITATAFDPACITATGDRVDYNNCTWDFGTIDGFVAVVADTYTIDLTMTYNDGSGTSMDIDFDGEITINELEIRGYLNMDFTLTADGQSLSYSMDADYDIDFIAGCANGTMEIHAEFSVPGSSAGDVWLLAEFGPACGQVVVR